MDHAAHKLYQTLQRQSDNNKDGKPNIKWQIELIYSITQHINYSTSSGMLITHDNISKSSYEKCLETLLKLSTFASPTHVIENETVLLAINHEIIYHYDSQNDIMSLELSWHKH